MIIAEKGHFTPDDVNSYERSSLFSRSSRRSYQERRGPGGGRKDARAVFQPTRKCRNEMLPFPNLHVDDYSEWGWMEGIVQLLYILVSIMIDFAKTRLESGARL